MDISAGWSCLLVENHANSYSDLRYPLTRQQCTPKDRLGDFNHFPLTAFEAMSRWWPFGQREDW